MESKEYRYDFSVVMPVYNTADYLREAVESLVRQTISFSRIQLILVDDGSKDGSGLICDEYREKYPENVTVIHKENGGASSARNTGLPYAEGRYINFLDSDDMMSPEAFYEVFRFFREHEEETDVCTIPVHYFEARNSEHWQNYKFLQGSRVIDLDTEYEATLMFVNASFYKHSLKDRMRFDSHLVCGEDTKVNLGILMEKRTFGAVAAARYLYRRRQNENNPSLVQGVQRKKGWYDDYFTYLTEWAFREYKTRLGYVPAFVQYEIMSDLQWRINGFQESAMEEVLGHDAEETGKYKCRLRSTLLQIEDRIILGMRMLSGTQKYAMLRLKYGREPQVEFSEGDAVLRYGETAAGKVSEMDVRWEFLTAGPEEGTFTLEGSFTVYGMDAMEMEPVFLVNGEKAGCEVLPEGIQPPKWLGESLYREVRFRKVIRPGTRTIEIRPVLRIKSVLIKVKNTGIREFFPVSGEYRNAAVYMQDHKIRFKDEAILIERRPGWFSRTAQEISLLSEIWKKNLEGGRKAVFGRLFYHFTYPLKRKQIWILSDRFNKADDNGEALFRYIMEQRPKGVKAVFAIRKDSADHERLRSFGPCIDAMKFRHKLLFLLADMNISSQADSAVVNPFSGHHEALRDLLGHQKFVFLQHGVIKDDLSGWLCRQKKNIAGFVTAARPEYRSIVEGRYGYPESAVWLTGLPRFDRLYRDEKRIITLVPSWRKYLMTDMDPDTSQWFAADTFEKSDYCRFYSSLLNSERLLQKLEETGYTLAFFPHPNVKPYISRFHCDPRVLIFPEGTSYSKIYAESSLLVTDYSSAVFDFAYLRKPVIYTQFDREIFFGGSHVYEKGYFDYERDGFGEVLYDLESTIDCMIEYVENKCELKGKYRNRIESFFSFHDQNNCARVLEKIEELSSGRRRH